MFSNSIKLVLILSSASLFIACGTNQQIKTAERAPTEKNSTQSLGADATVEKNSSIQSSSESKKEEKSAQTENRASTKPANASKITIMEESENPSGIINPYKIPDTNGQLWIYQDDKQESLTFNTSSRHYGLSGYDQATWGHSVNFHPDTTSASAVVDLKHETLFPQRVFFQFHSVDPNGCKTLVYEPNGIQGSLGVEYQVSMCVSNSMYVFFSHSTFDKTPDGAVSTTETKYHGWIKADGSVGCDSVDLLGEGAVCQKK